jgi:hypothetical protein
MVKDVIFSADFLLSGTIMFDFVFVTNYYFLMFLKCL